MFSPGTALYIYICNDIYRAVPGENIVDDTNLFVLDGGSNKLTERPRLLYKLDHYGIRGNFSVRSYTIVTSEYCWTALIPRGTQ